MESILGISQLGVAGLAVVLFYKLLVNHSRHVEIALQRLSDTIDKLCEKLDNKP